MMALRPVPPAILAALLLLPGCAEGEAPPTPSTELLTVEPAFLDLGSVTFGERRSGVFTVTNPGAEEVVISRIGPFSCSCASAELVLPARGGSEARRRLDGGRLGLALGPGETAEVHFVLDTSRYRQPTSRKVGSIPVVLRDGPGQTLQWGADIWTPFQVEPWLTDFGDVGMRERPEGFVLVVSHDTLEFSVDVDQEVDGWTVKSDPVSSDDSARRSYRITFTAPAELPEGPFRQDFVFHTNLQGAPPIRFSAQGRAVPDLSLSPGRLLLDPGRGRGEAEVRVVQRAAGGEVGPLRLGPLPVGLELVDEIAVEPRTRVLRFAWTGAAPAEALHDSLVIHTEDEEQPELKLDLSVLPRR
jgi:hypothetical protein